MQLEDMIIEEYKALRAEILLCLERRITIISYGLAAVGVLVGAGIAAVYYDKIVLAALVFLGVLPVTAVYVLDIWLAETRRARRASRYNWYLEKKLAAIMSATPSHLPLEWEARLRVPGTNGLFFEHYTRTVGYFALLAAASFGIGVYVLLGEAPAQLVVSLSGVKQWALALAWIPAAGVGIPIFRRRDKYAKWLQDEFDREPKYPD
jgi:hypothetical protein